MSKKVFISYSSKDREDVTILASDLEKLGFTVWFDQSLQGGHEWWAGILERIRRCDVFVLAVTRNSLESGPCGLERDYAVALRKRILPVLLGKVENWRLPASLQRLQYVSYMKRNHPAALALAGAILQLPSKTHLPNPLPPEPPIPLQGIPADELLSDVYEGPFSMRAHHETPDQQDSLRFSVCYPCAIPPGQWVSLRAYVYRPSGLRVVDEIEYRRLTQHIRHIESPATLQVKDGTRLTLTPRLPGVIFNPPDPAILAYEPNHSLPLKVWADPTIDGSRLDGRFDFTVGALVVATATFVMEVKRPTPVEPLPMRSKMYQTIYVCYATADERVSELVTRASKALGFEISSSVQALRAGAIWKDELRHAIDRADIFQLFWSHAAARSTAIESEWRYALSIADQKGPNFIRPIYWERDPMPAIPPELAHIHFTYTPLREPEK
ncbi:MAG: hypothetical protein BroJett018_26360 [Chloroflexota bacterium]|nr:MAG: hypothetical protein BroJett018_26360 [Chloroflexota bacterium]